MDVVYLKALISGLCKFIDGEVRYFSQSKLYYSSSANLRMKNELVIGAVVVNQYYLR